MFFITLLNKTQAYTSKKQAEEAATIWLLGNILSHLPPREEGTKFLDTFNQGNYSGCIKIWNDYAKKYQLIWGVHFQVIIKSVKTNQPFV